MKSAKKGDIVKIHYKGMLKDGTIFDSSFNQTPLEFILGREEVKQTLDKAIEGMLEGESKTFVLSPEEGYGRYHENYVRNVKKSEFPEKVRPELGMRLNMKSEDGKNIRYRVTNINEENITLDANHPLADKELTYEVKLLEVVPKI